ncbi:hypothetical protein GCM10010156_51310 [Planobispora rosea]|uniref:Uncharacterized protein n=1 Tax=Planobispora rosea TaxID=35762 RepID=A0A8J3S8Y7_PLARO|nr:hypothetical protein [Planobispora rosea]GGS86512.1 hypothetical protein GCM10010156_51310 [Planobispora rosea]GIH88285.1 hypothetical protein Pro02_66930 [Planobispora rosea]
MRRRARGWAQTLLALTGVTAVLAPLGGCAAPAPVRAMWLWHPADPAAVVEWATAQQVSEIFAYVPEELTAAERARLATLKKNADAAGIKLAALGGAPEWALDHAAALSWLRTAMGTGLFHAAHVDVEPYHLPAWRTDRAGTVASFTALLTGLRDADPRPLEADVPFWYHTVPAAPSGADPANSAGSPTTGGSGTLADEVLARTDAVTVMSYRDTATGPGSIMEISADMLRRGERAGRPVRLGAETLRLPDCPHCTFHGKGRAAMDAALAEVDAAAAGYPSFAGIAVHDYTAWTALPP